MGGNGKPKQAQRTKNNEKPSNSGRSAELLGNSMPTFVSLNTSSSFLTSGLSLSDKLPECFDSNVNSQYQVVLRKMGKKDPVTKAKALQLFIELISESELDVIKTVLPVWPKFYNSLSNDTDHRVREFAQQTHNVIVTKVGKFIAPYLKELSPVWLSSQYDNYVPAASIATASFTAAFSPAKIEEVCLFCQTEILDYLIRNITFHTPATLSCNSHCTPDEIEHKYQRIVVSSFKTLGFFIKQVNKTNIVIEGKCCSLFENQKFWIFSKHRNSTIKAAWFEMIYKFLQCKSDLIVNHKEQLIQITFKNMDDSDPIVVSHVWECILCIQVVYSDWIKHVHFQNTIVSKLSSIFKNGTNGNLSIICPNLLPFISNIYGKILKDITPTEFYNAFFKMVKNAIITVLCKSKSKFECGTVISSYFECIRYIVLKINQNSDTADVSENKVFATQLLHENVIDITKWSLSAKGFMPKLIYLHLSALIAFWSNNSSSLLYSELSREFWTNLFTIITETLSKGHVNEQCLEHIVNLINNLYHANPNLQVNRVKFMGNDHIDNQRVYNIEKENNPSLTYIKTDLKQLVIQLARLCLARAKEEKSVEYLNCVQNTSKLFADADFFEKLSDSDILTTLNILKNFLSDDYKTTETVIDIIFEVLNYVDRNEQTKCVYELLSVKDFSIIFWTLERMLSYPLCVQPEIQTILTQKNVSDIILKIAEDVINIESKENLNLLHKCFFITTSGDILITRATADGVLDILTQPLINKELVHLIDICGSFVSQVMPIAPNEQTFIKLFKFSIDSVVNDYLSSDTLWEITTCWQDSLVSLDINMNNELLCKCGKILSNRLFSSKTITAAEIYNIAEMISKLIIFSTENIDEENVRLKAIESTFDILIREIDASTMLTNTSIAELCLILEIINGKATALQLPSNNVNYTTLHNFITKNLFYLSLIPKLTSSNGNSIQKWEEDLLGYQENKLLETWTTNIYNIVTESLKVCAIGESLLINSYLVSDEELTIMLTLSEEVKKLLQNTTDEQASEIKRLLFTSTKDNDFASCRAIPMLKNMSYYKQYKKNAIVVLLEDVCGYLIDNDSLVAYMNTLQIMLPYLSRKALSLPNKIWESSDNMLFRIGTIRCMILNYFREDSNNITDQEIVSKAINLITSFGAPGDSTKHELILSNSVIWNADMVNVLTVVEFINLLIEILNRFPMEMNIEQWDVIRICLSSWVLSISRSIEKINNPKVLIFVPAVYKLFAALTKLIRNEKIKSSTTNLTKIIDEWQNLFEREVNLVLFDNFIKAVELKVERNVEYETILAVMSDCIEYLDFSILFKSYLSTNSNKLDNLIGFCLINLTNPIHNVKCSAMFILKNISPFLISMDSNIIDQKVDNLDRYDNSAENSWHLLSKFRSYIEEYNELIRPYTEEFSSKSIDISSFQPIDKNAAINCFIIWDCIIFICYSSPAELRSVYAKWLYDNKYEQNVLNFLIRTMPEEILKNYDKPMNNNIFKGLTWLEIKQPDVEPEKYSCHLYMEILRRLPVVVRKWWSSLQSRQKAFVDKLTTNFASTIICQEELDAISSKIEKQKNMQVSIHSSTREVKAIYLIDEVRMEIGIILSSNYPLGSVKVDIGKQIGGRASWRNVGMQLTIFLTHQNGSIYDGLTLWKKNLDKKFEGVEECYICYTVIHQDTCQFPKLTCSTCKKKFHGPCLYKWFTTSNKSTCPICRNIF